MKRTMRDWPIGDLLMLAQLKLMGTDKITKYTMVDGVEQRRTANPIKGICESLDKMSDKMGLLIDMAKNYRQRSLL